MRVCPNCGVSYDHTKIEEALWHEGSSSPQCCKVLRESSLPHLKTMRDLLNNETYRTLCRFLAHMDTLRYRTETLMKTLTKVATELDTLTRRLVEIESQTSWNKDMSAAPYDKTLLISVHGLTRVGLRHRNLVPSEFVDLHAMALFPEAWMIAPEYKP